MQAFRDPGNLRHQVGLVLAKIWDAIGAVPPRDPTPLLLGLDALAWTYMQGRPELVRALEGVHVDHRAGRTDPMQYCMEQVRIYVHCLRLEGVIDRAPLSVGDATDWLREGAVSEE